MPRPLYIICSESGVEDKVTGLTSLFNVIERITFSKVPVGKTEEATVRLVPLRVTAVWMRLKEDDPQQEYQYQLLFKFDPGNRSDVVSEGTFFFSRPLHRFTLSGAGIAFEKPGTFTAECKIRRPGDESWLSQDYPINVDEIPFHKDQG